MFKTLNLKKALLLVGFVRSLPEDIALLDAAEEARYVGRMRVRDATAITYRMGAGFPGDVNREHPFNVEAALICAATPPLYYGQAVVIDAASQGVRPLAAGDQALTAVYGVTVRPFPIQSSVPGNNYAAATIGAATPPATGVIDVLRSGSIMILLPAGQTPVKGNPARVWTAASAGAHVQGLFEVTDPAGNGMTIADTKTTYNGGVDSSGVGELLFNA